MQFYGYKKCSTCREAYKYLQSAGQSLIFHDFVEQPPTRQQLADWIRKRGEGIAPFVNVKGTRYKELGLKDKSLSETEWLDLLTTDGKLLKRPVLVAGDRVVIGFDRAAYDDVLDQR